MIKRFLIIILLFGQVLAAQQLSWPEITRMNRPWTRWWWPGSIVTPAGLTAAMEKYKKAGLGGMEIAVIYGVKGQEEKFITYLSPEWMKMFTHTLREADRLDLGIDLANASGWPFGGPWVDPAEACKNINLKTYSLKGGETLDEKIEFMQQPLVRAVGQMPDITKLADPVSKNKDLQLYALDQIRFEKKLPLYTLMAYSDSGQVMDLTPLITPERRLDWTAPSGKWDLYALFRGWHGKQAERAGPGGEGDVIDHFSGTAITNYLKHFDTIFKDYDLKSLRGYFNDSYEVDDASGQADWTDNLFYEFRIRRGYDLSGYLPALFQKDDPEKNARVLSDYRQTISDLLLEKFTTRWTEWAHRQGKFTRDQAHGSPGNILDLYAASDIPETEGNEITRLKFASSAANVTGKQYTSCEAATWLGEHFTSSLADVKRAVDIFFLAGVNHVFYHGTCYSPQDEPWPGFLFYASVEFTPANSFWDDFEGLNNYVARVQSFMQQGMSDNDILIYFPIFDRYADYSRGMLEHFDAVSPRYNETPFKSGIETMLAKGYSFDYISDLQIKNTEVSGGILQTEGNEYKTLVLPGCKYIPIETLTHILKLANEGARIIVLGDLPETVAGWADLGEKQGLLEHIKSSITFTATNTPGVSKTVFGNGSILLGNDLNDLLSFAGIRRESMADNYIQFTRRINKAGYYYFVCNKGEQPFDGWLKLQVKSSYAALFNPLTGESGIAKSRVNKEGTLEIYTRMVPGESMIISATNDKLSGQLYPFYDPLSQPLEITGNWKIAFVSGGPVLAPEREIPKLMSWTESGDDDLKNFSGTARYTINFARPSGKADAWTLNLGKVCGSARITLNRREIAVSIGPDHRVTIGEKQLMKMNTLTIDVSNLMGNRIAYLDRNNIGWKKFYNINFAARLKENTRNGVFDASSWPPQESGLIGPVTLTPVKTSR